MTYTIKTTTKPNGSTLHECFDSEGKLIGKRTSKNRVYNFCLVVCDRKESKIERLEKEIKYAQKQIAQYAELGDAGSADEAVQIQLKHDPKTNAWGLQCARKYWFEGNYQVWAKKLEKDVERYEEKLAAIERGDFDDEYAKPVVLSWHGEAKNVPNVPEHLEHVATATRFVDVKTTPEKHLRNVQHEVETLKAEMIRLSRLYQIKNEEAMKLRKEQNETDEFRKHLKAKIAFNKGKGSIQAFCEEVVRENAINELFKLDK